MPQPQPAPEKKPRSLFGITEVMTRLHVWSKSLLKIAKGEHHITCGGTCGGACAAQIAQEAITAFPWTSEV